MFEILKQAIELIRKKRQLDRDTRRLHIANLDYAALRNIVNEVSNRNVEIQISTNAGTMIIRPKPINELNFKSFNEKLAETRSNR